MFVELCALFVYFNVFKTNGITETTNKTTGIYRNFQSSKLKNSKVNISDIWQ